MVTKPLFSDHAVPPGHYVKEALEYYGMTQNELAERTGRPVQAISEIVNGKKAITEETAFELESVLNTPAHVWLNLEHSYRYVLHEHKKQERLKVQTDLLAKYPYAELVKYGWVKSTRNPLERVNNLLQFFAVANLEIVNLSYSAAFRRATTSNSSAHALAAWLRIGQKLSEVWDIAQYDHDTLVALLPELRGLTRFDNPTEHIQQLLSKAGVTFVMAPHLRKTFANGATFRHGGRPVIMLSQRGVYEDISWFTLFHEIGHILLHQRSQTFIEGIEVDPVQERQADDFAQNTLIGPDVWARFTSAGVFTQKAIEEFAEECGICPALVVGRLMREYSGYAKYNHLSALRRKSLWSL